MQVQRVIRGIRLHAKELPHGRRKGHRRRPHLVRARPAQRLVEAARQQLGHGSRILRPGEVEVLPQRRIARQWMAGAIQRRGRPPGKQGPYRAAMVADGIVRRVRRRQRARSPVRRKRMRRPCLQLRLRQRQTSGMRPEGHGRVDGLRGVIAAVAVFAEGIQVVGLTIRGYGLL